MDPLEPFLLPPDVLLTAVADLPEHIRSQVSGDGEFAITRPRARSATRMLSRDAAELLEEFRTAKTVVEAVISYCAAKGSEPPAPSLSFSEGTARPPEECNDHPTSAT